MFFLLRLGFKDWKAIIIVSSVYFIFIIFSFLYFKISESHVRQR